MSVSVSEILAGAAAQAVPLSAECAGYLVLAAADQSAVSPRRVGAGEVCLLEDGAVRVVGGAAADEGTIERDLRELLGELLLAASSPTSGLLRVQRRTGGNGVGALQRELETALIPVNRAAARRALARLARETARAKDEGRLAELPAKPKSAALAPAAPPAGPPAAAAPAPVVAAAAPPLSHEADPVTASPAPVEVTAPHFMPPVAPSAREESETVPEPIVRRASFRPPAPPSPALAVGPADSPEAPPVLASEARVVTPLLGTRVDSTEPLNADVLVTFAENERTVIPEDGELIVLDADGMIANADSIDLTEPCPPLSESSEAPAVVVEPMPMPTPTPFPHLPMPRPRESDVDDLIARLTEVPLAVGEVRAGLKRLAGL